MIVAIVSVENSEVIRLHGFEIDGEILLSDSVSMGKYKKVDVVLPEDYLKFLIEENNLIRKLNIEY